MTNSADPDKLASEEANWSGSTLFAKKGHVVFSNRWVKNSFFLLFQESKNILCKPSSKETICMQSNGKDRKKIMHFLYWMQRINLSDLQTKPGTCADSVDPDETAHN